jgi:Flp pilus assembly pilin Flp
MRRNILKAANTAKKEVSAFLKDESGASVLEVVLLLVEKYFISYSL